MFGCCCSLASFFCKFWHFQGWLQKVTNTRDVFWEVGRKVLSAPGNKNKLWATFDQSGKKRTQLKHRSTKTVANYLTQEKKQLFSRSSFLSRAHIFFFKYNSHLFKKYIYINAHFKQKIYHYFTLGTIKWVWKTAARWCDSDDSDFQPIFTCALLGWCWLFSAGCMTQTCWLM